jgi:hypothetical protein
MESDGTNRSQSSSEIETSDPDTTPTVFIKTFPFGRAGASIEAPDLSAMTGSGVTPPEDSIWAPFCSQRDWEIARWAKTHRLTSSAFSELLAIPEVPVFILSNHSNANTKYRLSTGLNYHTIL